MTKLPFSFWRKNLPVLSGAGESGDLPFHDHSGVRAVDPYAFQVAHRRLAWMLRISAGMNIALVAGLVMTLSSFQALLPLKETQLALLRVDPADQRIYRVEPISVEADGFKLLLEQRAQRFVIDLLEVDPVTQAARFRDALGVAGNELRPQLIRDFADSGLVDDILKAGLTREIHIVSVDHLRSFSVGVYKLAVDYERIDRKGEKVTAREELRAYLSMAALADTVRESEKYENPLGIRVLALSIKFRGLGQDANQEVLQ